MSDIPKNLKKFRKESQMTQQREAAGGTACDPRQGGKGAGFCIYPD